MWCLCSFHPLVPSGLMGAAANGWAGGRGWLPLTAATAVSLLKTPSRPVWARTCACERPTAALIKVKKQTRKKRLFCNHLASLQQRTAHTVPAGPCSASRPFNRVCVCVCVRGRAWIKSSFWSWRKKGRRSEKEGEGVKYWWENEKGSKVEQLWTVHIRSARHVHARLCAQLWFSAKISYAYQKSFQCNFI